MMDRYILVDGKPVFEPDLMIWAEWFEKNSERIIQHNLINGILISTVFLGLDHNYDAGPPLLWETMIFDLYHEDPQWRYTSHESALKGHQRAIRKVDLAIRKKHRRFAMHVPMTGRIITHPISPLWRDWKSWKNR